MLRVTVVVVLNSAPLDYLDIKVDFREIFPQEAAAMVFVESKCQTATASGRHGQPDTLFSACQGLIFYHFERG